MLHLIHLLLPPECCQLTPSLPNLLSYAVRGRPHSAPLTYDFPLAQNSLNKSPCGADLSSNNNAFTTRYTSKTKGLNRSLLYGLLFSWKNVSKQNVLRKKLSIFKWNYFSSTTFEQKVAVVINLTLCMENHNLSFS